MLTRDQVLEAVKSGQVKECIDGRNYGRLCAFFPMSDWPVFGMVLKEGATPQETKEFNRDTVIEQLKSDVAFGFEKALGQRGISASLMNDVVKMWMWVLEDDLQNFDDYAQYGLPLLKAVAVKYGFENPIGDKRGDECDFASDGY